MYLLVRLDKKIFLKQKCFIDFLTRLISYLYFVKQKACPTIVKRAEWGARPPLRTVAMNTPVPFVVIHHAASGSCTNKSSCSSMVKGFQTQHMNSNVIICL